MIMRKVDTRFVPALWPVLREGFAEARDKGHGEFSDERIEALATLGTWTVYVVLGEKEELTGAILVAESWIEDKEFWVEIPYGFSKLVQPAVTEETFDELDRIYKDREEYRGIRFFSGRRGWARAARRMNFKKGLVQWVRPVDREESHV